MKLYYYEKKEGHNSTDTDRMILESLESHCGKKQCAFRVKRTENGKPYVENSPLFVGVTHTKELVIVGIDDKNFGIDCEDAKRTVKKAESIAEKYFSHNEREYILENGVVSSEKFLEIWVKKEAYVKFLGTGVKDMKSFDSFSVAGCYEKVNYGNNIIYIYKE